MILYYAEFKNKQVRYWTDRGASFLSYEALPEAIKNNIAVLELADFRVYIAGVGRKTKSSYWLDVVGEDEANAFYKLNQFEDDE